MKTEFYVKIRAESKKQLNTEAMETWLLRCLLSQEY